jgi:cephalosporin-C deacetylase-like acetyl esterase
MPLLFDMSLEKLHAYQGINPRPHDFDTFWHDSLNEMQSIDPDIEITPAEFQADILFVAWMGRRSSLCSGIFFWIPRCWHVL